MREFMKIWFFCIGAAVFYGLVHDQVTAHICVEYFSVGHPTILPLTSPALLALQWGIVATWWVGALLGVGLAASARLGSQPPWTVRDLRPSIAALLACMAIASALSGAIGYELARRHLIFLTGWLASAVPQPRHARFLADLWAHSAAYLVGFLGGVLLCARTYRLRKKATLSPVGDGSTQRLVQSLQ